MAGSGRAALRWLASARGEPFQLSQLAAIMLTCVEILAGLAAPASTSQLPGWARAAWLALLAVTCAVGLAGALWRGRLATGLVLELVGVGLLGTATLVYGAAVLAVSPRGGLVAATFVLGISAGAWGRVVRILVGLRQLAALPDGGAPACPARAVRPAGGRDDA